MNCQNIDAQLLVKFIRLKKPARINVDRHSDFAQKLNTTDLILSNSMTDETDRQIDISFPSSSYAPQIDMEIIEMSLSVENFRIEKKLNESENEYFRRVTIQLDEANGKIMSFPDLWTVRFLSRCRQVIKVSNINF